MEPAGARTKGAHDRWRVGAARAESGGGSVGAARAASGARQRVRGSVGAARADSGYGDAALGDPLPPRPTPCPHPAYCADYKFAVIDKQSSPPMAYKDLVPVGSALLIGATSFGLGAIYGNWPYDVETLFRYDPTGQSFERSLAHYLVWANAPPYVHYTLHAVMALGLIGCFVKLYKPDPDATYFEYGSLGLFVLAIIIYLTNLRTGLYSCVHQNWGEVDMKTGLNVMAALQIMIVVVLAGVLVLQGGLYYATWYDAKLKADFLRREAEHAAEPVVVAEEVVVVEEVPVATATGAKPKSKAKKTTKKA